MIRSQLLLYRARIHLLHNQAQFGLEDLWRAQQLAPDSFDTPETQQLLADSCLSCFEQSPVGAFDRQNIIKAQRIYQDIVTDFPQYNNLGWIHYQQGRAYLAVNNADEATTCFQKALNNLSQENTLKAYCYERLGFIEFYLKREFKRALEFLELALAVYPSDASSDWLVSTHLLCSRVLYAQGQTEAAIHSAETAVNIASENSENNQSVLAEALLSAGELLNKLDWHEQEALAYLERFLRVSTSPHGIDVTWSRVHEIIGDLYHRLKDYEQAGEAYTTALKFNPHHPWQASIYYRAAQCHYQQGKYDTTISLIKRLLTSAQLESSPITDYRVYDILGNAQFALAQYQDAKVSYQTAMQLAPDTAKGLDKIKLYYHFSHQLAAENQSVIRSKD
jgi:tetratricopeptide (TPR) repeat protein